MKKTGPFDITMGAYHGAEVCEIVGLYILNNMRQHFPNINFGLYRDDGLGTHSRMDGPTLNRTKKEIIKLFQSFGLKITIETNMQQVDFLDVTMNLQKDTFQPYKKPNSKTQYVHAKSNHPPKIIENIPKSVNKRINELSCGKETFQHAKAEYNNALKECGYSERLEYEEDTSTTTTNETNATNNKINRKRKIIWYNPPFNASITSNIGKQFLTLVKKHFHKKHPFHKIFNKNTVKLSYSCTKNIASIIQSHNLKIINENNAEPTNTTTKTCNCRNKANCPLKGQCLTETIIYKAKLETQTGTKEYIGSTERDFKTRYNGHTQSFRTQYKSNATALSQCVWEQNLQPNPTVNWEILQHTHTYKPGNRMCDLCTSEKLHILKTINNRDNLNKRNEICKRCPHRDKHTLKAVK